MKKFLSIILALFLCIGVVPFTAFADEVSASATPGDVNNDGYVDNTDAAIVLKYDAGIINLSDAQKVTGDVNYDGLVDNTDAASILKYDAGIISMFCKEHNFTVATDCLHPETCINCGLKRGAGSHSWTAATCTAPKTCTLCGETTGEKKAHSWKAATCSTPKTCTSCGATSGSATNNHFYSGAKCITCGKTDPQITTRMNAFKSFITDEGEYDYSTNTYYIVASLSNTVTFGLMYDLDEPSVIRVSVKTTTDSSSDTYCLSALEIDPTSSTNEVVVGLYEHNSLSIVGGGEIYPSSFSTNSKNIYEFFCSHSSYTSSLKSACASQIDLAITAFAAIVENIGYTAGDFGYIQY